MSPYEKWNLLLTAIYNLLTFGLLCFVVYEALVKPKQPRLALYFQRTRPDTQTWATMRKVIIDFIIENRGPELKNLKIMSEPNHIGWGNTGTEGMPSRATSEYFPTVWPHLAEGERWQFLWCEVDANEEILKRPVKLIVEFDNPAFVFPRRIQRSVIYDLSALEYAYLGANQKYDIHNVAQEAARLREEAERLNIHLGKIAKNLDKHAKENAQKSS